MQRLARKPYPRERWSKGQWLTLLKGIANANVLAAALLQLIVHMAPVGPGYYATGATVLVPLLMGLISAYCWRDLKPTGWQLFGWSLLNTMVGVILCHVFLGEGAICLIMASPLLLVLTCIGASIGNILFKARPGPLQASVVPVLLVWLLADSLFPRPQNHYSVTTQLRVNASPSVVYPHIFAFPQVANGSSFWLSRLGLPYPIATTVDGQYVGAERVCHFSGNVVMRERITRLVPNREMDLEITEMPKYPEIADHVTISQGCIKLIDNGDGTTTLVGKTYYSLYVYPTFYFGPWCDYVINVGGTRVFREIKALSEAPTASIASTPITPNAPPTR